MTREAAKKVCKECPFRRKACPGYLGAASGEPAQGFLNPHYNFSEIPLPCHCAVNWEKGERGDEPLCRGFLIFMKNSCKMPRDPEVLAAWKTVEADHEDIFSWAHEFTAHHDQHLKGKSA